MTHNRIVKSILIIIAITLAAGNAQSYHYKTHALCAKLAAELVRRLDAAKNRYDEIYDLSHIIQLGIGAWEEDNGNFAGNNRAMRHYYDPDCPDKKKGVPYYSHYKWWRILEPGTEVTKPSGGRYAGALEWARNGAVSNWSSANPFNWEGAIEAYDYTNSSRLEAYYRMGHVIHLLTDMAEPDHALNMPHPGSSKGLPDTLDDIIGQKMADAIMNDIKSMQLSAESKSKIAWLLFVNKIKQLALRSRRLGYEMLIDDFIHPKYVEEFFKGKDAIHLVKSETTSDTLPPIQGKHLPDLYKFDDFFNSMARRSKLAVSDRKKYAIPLGLHEFEDYSIIKQMFYMGQPIFLIPAIDMNDETEKQKYYSLAWQLLEKATEYSANLLMHFYDIVNPPPYVREVTVTQDGKLKYRGYWEDILGLPGGEQGSKDPHHNYAIVKKREFRNPVNDGIMHGKRADIKIIFGPKTVIPEKMDKDSVKVTIGGKAVPGSIKNDGNPHIWEGSFPVPKLSENEKDKIVEISIAASDADMHWTAGPIQGSTLDSDPYTPAKVVCYGPGNLFWINHESATASEKRDTNHKIKIVKEEEVLPFDIFFTEVARGLGPPYSLYVWYHTSLSTRGDILVQIFEKEAWGINRANPSSSWYTRTVQHDGYFEFFKAKPRGLETPSQDQITEHSKYDGDADGLNPFAEYKNEEIGQGPFRKIIKFGPQGSLYDEEDESKILKWKYRGKGRDGKIYEAELVFDFKGEWTVDQKRNNIIIYKRIEDKN